MTPVLIICFAFFKVVRDLEAPEIFSMCIILQALKSMKNGNQGAVASALVPKWDTSASVETCGILSLEIHGKIHERHLKVDTFNTL